jgi:endonuclease-8
MPLPYAPCVPEGDAIHRAARRLQVLVGQELQVETPHPRAAVKQLAPRLDGRRLDSVEAIGKNLLFRFEGGLVLRSHLRMSGRWRVLERDAAVFGTPWLVLRGARHAGVLWNGPVLELDRGVAQRLGPDILAEPPDYETMVRRLHTAAARQVGDALLDQRLVSGIGNVWKVESLWTERISPWRAVADLSDDQLRSVLAWAHSVMRARVDGVPYKARVYRRKGHMCPRCGTPVKAWPQGDAARMTYWCPRCQTGEDPSAA